MDAGFVDYRYDLNPVELQRFQQDAIDQFNDAIHGPFPRNTNKQTSLEVAPQGIQQLMDDEGFREFAVPDTLAEGNPLTIGHGHKLKDNPIPQHLLKFVSKVPAGVALSETNKPKLLEIMSKISRGVSVNEDDMRQLREFVTTAPPALKITKFGARQLLIWDMVSVAKSLEKQDFFKRLSPIRKMTLVNMGINLGVTGLIGSKRSGAKTQKKGFEKMIQAIEHTRNGVPSIDYAKAAREIVDSAAFIQTKGNRYLKLAIQFLLDEFQK